MASDAMPEDPVYPSRVMIDMRLLGMPSLQRYMRSHDIKYAENIAHAELAAMCAKHMRDTSVSETDVIEVFLTSLQPGGNQVDVEPSKRTRSTRSRTSNSGKPEQLRRGDQVAAQQNPEEWILATVVRHNADHDRYILEDEDDEKTFELSSGSVVGLNESLEGVERGDEVLAVFPDTTSFYRAFVSKSVRRGAEDCNVQFVDDEDASGNTPHRRIPARYVLRMSDVAAAARSANNNLQYDSDEEEEESPSKKTRR